MNQIEHIEHDSQVLCIIIRSDFQPDQTIFVTPPEYKQQVGFVVHLAEAEIARHSHRPLERHLTGTSEVLVVKRGRCLVDIYSSENELVGTKEIGVGDVMLMVSGGHGFRMIEDTVFLEIKQGPYTGLDEKTHF